VIAFSFGCGRSTRGAAVVNLCVGGAGQRLSTGAAVWWHRGRGGGLN
jgi:membrane-bound inhibitor of C-type lysozyme